jgi:exosortase
MATVHPGTSSWAWGRYAAYWPVWLGLATLTVPTVISLAQQSWAHESGVHGPLMIFAAAWLTLRRSADIRAAAEPSSPMVAAALLIPALVAYVFGRAFDFLFIETAALLGVGVGVFYACFGGRALRIVGFPIFYLCFAIPLPGWFVDQLTAPLKTLVSLVATDLLQAAGIPVIREGVTLYIAQYQLLVEDACAGLNSIISLTAIGLLYVFMLHNASWRYSAFLLLWIVPVAIVANIVRVIILVLITYYGGDAMAQGYLHSTAGIVMFATALLLIFAIDSVLKPVGRRIREQP